MILSHERFDNADSVQVFLNDDLSEHSFQLVDGEWHDLLE